MNTLLSDIFYPPQQSISSKENDFTAHTKRLHDVLSSWNFKSLSVPGDGNCLFTAVAMNLQNLATKNKDLSDHLQSLEIQIHENTIEDIVKK